MLYHGLEVSNALIAFSDCEGRTRSTPRASVTPLHAARPFPTDRPVGQQRPLLRSSGAPRYILHKDGLTEALHREIAGAPRGLRGGRSRNGNGGRERGKGAAPPLRRRRCAEPGAGVRPRSGSGGGERARPGAATGERRRPGPASARRAGTEGESLLPPSLPRRGTGPSPEGGGCGFTLQMAPGRGLKWGRARGDGPRPAG